MSWVAVDKDGTEVMFEDKPERVAPWGIWCKNSITGSSVECLSKGTIKKLIGRDLTWEDDCVELK